MTTNASEEKAAWPTVLASELSEWNTGTCSHCSGREGQPHGRECVRVVKTVEHRITIRLSADKTVSGRWTFKEPHHWDEAMSLFHVNDGAWCASNILQADARKKIVWDEQDDEVWRQIEIICAEDCLCPYMSTTFVRVVDANPHRLGE